MTRPSSDCCFRSRPWASRASRAGRQATVGAPIDQHRSSPALAREAAGRAKVTAGAPSIIRSLAVAVDGSTRDAADGGCHGQHQHDGQEDELSGRLLCYQLPVATAPPLQLSPARKAGRKYTTGREQQQNEGRAAIHQQVRLSGSAGHVMRGAFLGAPITRAACTAEGRPTTRRAPRHLADPAGAHHLTPSALDRREPGQRPCQQSLGHTGAAPVHCKHFHQVGSRAAHLQQRGLGAQGARGASRGVRAWGRIGRPESHAVLCWGGPVLWKVASVLASLRVARPHPTSVPCAPMLCRTHRERGAPLLASSGSELLACWAGRAATLLPTRPRLAADVGRPAIDFTSKAPCLLGCLTKLSPWSR